MSNMLRGLPMQSQTTQMYQAQPTATQQAIGLGGTAAALGAAFGTGKKEGGIIGMKEGGSVPGFNGTPISSGFQLYPAIPPIPEPNSIALFILGSAIFLKSR